MTTYPGAITKLIPPGESDPRIRPVGVVFHVAVSEAASLYDWFRSAAAGGLEAHYYIRRDGTVECYRDNDVQADAQAAGNSWWSGTTTLGLLSVETQGMGEGVWTDEQVRAGADLVRWASAHYGFPVRAITSPQPGSAAGGGVGYHRQFPAWNPHGHLCPGDDRVPQVRDIIRLAQGDDMPLTDADVDKVVDAIFAKQTLVAGDDQTNEPEFRRRVITNQQTEREREKTTSANIAAVLELVRMLGTTAGGALPVDWEIKVQAAAERAVRAVAKDASS